jgi:hypothetical protein
MQDCDANYHFKGKGYCVEQALLDFGFFPEKPNRVYDSVVVVRARRTEDGPEEAMSDLAPCFNGIVPFQITLPCNAFSAK